MDESTQDQQLSSQNLQPQIESVKSSKLDFKLIGLGLLLLIVIIIGAFWVGRKTTSSSQTLQQTKPEILPTIVDTPTESLQNITFQKKIYNLNHNIWALGNNPYPVELSSRSDDELVGLDCLPRYVKDPDPLGQYLEYNSEEGKERSKLESTELLNFIKKNSNISAITGCRTENNKTLVIYEIASGGGGAGNTVHIGYLNANSEIPKPISIEENNETLYAEAYFGCYVGPLALTINDLFYFSCGGGRIQTVFVADLNKTSFKLIHRCKADSEESKIQCS